MENDDRIFVIYLAVGNMDNIDIEKYCRTTADKYINGNIMNISDKVIVLPITGFDSRVECINPKYITDPELIKEHEEMLKIMKNKMNDKTVLYEKE